MKKILLLAGVILLAGCAPYKVSVFGASGKQFAAPSLCAALIECKKSGEASCYYDSTVITDPSGSKQQWSCKEVTK